MLLSTARWRLLARSRRLPRFSPYVARPFAPALALPVRTRPSTTAAARTEPNEIPISEDDPQIAHPPAPFPKYRKADGASPASQDHAADSIQQDDSGPSTGDLGVPEPHELPGWARLRTEDPTLFTDVSRCFNTQVEEGRFSATQYQKSDSDGKDIQVTVLTATIGEDSWTVKTQYPGYLGSNLGKRVATLRLLAALQSEAMCDKIFPQKTDLQQHDESLLDVYNYCASLNAVPSFDMGQAQMLSVPAIQYTITLEEQGIQATAVALKDQKWVAQHWACLRFKEAAEKYVARKKSKSILAMVARDAGRLSTDNAEKFLDWLKQDARLSYRFSDVNKSDSGWNSVRVRYSMDTTINYTNTPQIYHPSLSIAKKAACLHAAVSIAQGHPELVPKFIAALWQGKGHVARVSRPVAFKISDAVSSTMRETTDIDIDLASLSIGTTSTLPKFHRDYWKTESIPIERARVNMKLAKLYQNSNVDPERKRIRDATEKLPVYQCRHDITMLLEKNVYTILIGTTGSGKTTQIPQMILADFCRSGIGSSCNVICTQPRRIAATSVATRVAEEMGPELRDRVGYHVRYDKKTPGARLEGGCITYCTTGILLQQLQLDSDSVLDYASHLILDEVHERDLILDFTLTVLKRAVADRQARGKKVPKILLMSATMDKEPFLRYFQNVGSSGKMVEPPTIVIPGTSFPVQHQYLDSILPTLQEKYTAELLNPLLEEPATAENLAAEAELMKVASAEGGEQQATTIDWKARAVYDDLGVISKVELNTPTGLTAATIAHAVQTTEKGAVLVFLPGLNEIEQVQELLQSGPVLGVDLANEKKFKLYLLHSSLPDSQRTVFEKPPEGVRKIILSSNVAESSVTIPDVVCVVDTGKVRELQYDNGMRASWLRTSWVSKSSARQRAGRAGRVQSGIYMALYSNARYSEMRDVAVPELLRSDLQSTCLAVKSNIHGVDVAEFLADAIEPPKSTSVQEALDALVGLGALTGATGNLTPLGGVLVRLRVHPSLAKMIIAAVVFRCVDPIVTIGATADARNLIVGGKMNRESYDKAIEEFGKGTGSDHLTKYNVFMYLKGLVRKRGLHGARTVAFAKGLHWGAFQSVNRACRDIEDALQEAGILSRCTAQSRASGLIGGLAGNVNSNKPHIIKAVLLAGLQPNLGLRRPSKKDWLGYQLGNRPESAVSHTSSVKPFAEKERGDVTLVTFSELVKSADGKLNFLRDCTAVSPLTAMFFGGDLTANEDGDRHNGKPLHLLTNDWLQWAPICDARAETTVIEKMLRAEATDMLLRFRANLDKALALSFGRMGRRHDITVDDGAFAAASQHVASVVRALDAEAGIALKQDLLKTEEDKVAQLARQIEADLEADILARWKSWTEGDVTGQGAKEPEETGEVDSGVANEVEQAKASEERGASAAS